jgi:hypothetical protein
MSHNVKRIKAIASMYGLDVGGWDLIKISEAQRDEVHGNCNHAVLEQGSR